jgi:hypothetical protein
VRMPRADVASAVDSAPGSTRSPRSLIETCAFILSDAGDDVNCVFTGAARSAADMTIPPILLMRRCLARGKGVQPRTALARRRVNAKPSEMSAQMRDLRVKSCRAVAVIRQACAEARDETIPPRQPLMPIRQMIVAARSDDRTATSDDRAATSDDRTATSDDRTATSDGRTATSDARSATPDARRAMSYDR